MGNRDIGRRPVSHDNGDLSTYTYDVTDQGLIERIRTVDGRPAAQRERDNQAGAQKLPHVDILTPGTTTKQTVNIDGMERDLYLHIPKGYNGKDPVPLMLVYNGFNSPTNGAAGMEEKTGFSKKADDDNFIVAYMDGNPHWFHGWNNGEWIFSHLNDLKFTQKVIDELQPLKVDPDKRYLVGYSEGGSFVHQAANELPGHQIKGIADVSGFMAFSQQHNAKDISVLALHSAYDQWVPAGGRKFFVEMHSLNDTNNFYRKVDGITTPPTQNLVTERDGSTLEENLSQNPKTHTYVETMLFRNAQHDLPHSWFGGPKEDEYFPVKASDLICDFFGLQTKAQTP